MPSWESASSASDSDSSEPACEHRPKFLLHSLCTDPFDCDRLSCNAQLLCGDNWQPESYDKLQEFSAPPCSYFRLCALLRAAHLQGCHVYFEYPSGCMQDVKAHYIQLRQELATHCIQWHLPQGANTSIICSTDSQVSTITQAADLFSALVRLPTKHCAKLLNATICFDAFQKHMPSCYLPKRPAVCDGAGMFSTADHSANNINTKPKTLAQLARNFENYLMGLLSI